MGHIVSGFPSCSGWDLWFRQIVYCSLLVGRSNTNCDWQWYRDIRGCGSGMWCGSVLCSESPGARIVSLVIVDCRGSGVSLGVLCEGRSLCGGILSGRPCW